jgi:hypothetical protein
VTRETFTKAISDLVTQCGVPPLDEELDARVAVIWDEVQGMSIERFQAGIRVLIRRRDFKFFPTLGELLGAIDDSYSSHPGEQHPDRMTELYDRLYEKEMREMEKAGAAAEQDENAVCFKPGEALASQVLKRARRKEKKS